jgi:hypothetical protein
MPDSRTKSAAFPKPRASERVNELPECLMLAHSPPWSRRGGRAIKKMAPVPLIGADGVVCSTSRSHLIDRREALLMNPVRYASICKEASRHLQTTPAAPANEASRHLLDGRSHPSLTKEGSSPDPDGVKCARVSLRKEVKTHTHNSFTASQPWVNQSEGRRPSPTQLQTQLNLPRRCRGCSDRSG